MSTFIVEWNAHVTSLYSMLPGRWISVALRGAAGLFFGSFPENQNKHNCSYFFNLINVYILAESTPQRTTVIKMTAVNASPATVTSTIPATTIIGIAVGKEREKAMERAIFACCCCMHAFAVCLFCLL